MFFAGSARVKIYYEVTITMPSLLPTAKNIKIGCSIGTPTAKLLSKLDTVLIVLPPRVAAGTWRQLPQDAKIKQLLKKSAPGTVPGATLRLANPRQTSVLTVKTKEPLDAFEQLTLGRKLVAAAKPARGDRIGIWVCGFEPAEQRDLTLNIAAAALAAGFQMPSFKSDKPKPAPVGGLQLLGLGEEIDTRRLLAEAGGNNLARWLTSLPPNVLTDVTYADTLEELAGQQGWDCTRFGIAELRELGAGAFLAVAQGNRDDSAAIVRLRYRPGDKRGAADLSLVGKGIIFDTGGTNLKPFASMLEMHTDMQGSAVALGTLFAIASLGLDIAVDCWLAITENRTGSTAYKSQDLVTAANGKTIQVIHTDAEGRMALADALTLACRDKPGLLIDYATLTGSCVTAITTRYSGIFTNRPNLHPLLKRTGKDCGERVWPFPMEKEFLEELKSDLADLKQCTQTGGGDHIMAACFLHEFIEGNVPWLHIDLSASTHSKGLAHIPTDVTGFGVRYTLGLLLDAHVLDSDLS